MQKQQTLTYIKYNLLLTVVSLFFVNVAFSNNFANYPQKVKIIKKSEATYETPNNTYTAMISALIAKDIEWYYKAFTMNSALRIKQLCEEAGVSPERIFSTVSDQSEFNILLEKKYKDGVLLIIRSEDPDGDIFQGSTTFIKEGSLWKITDKYSADEELHTYMKYFKIVPIGVQTKITKNRVKYDKKTHQFYSNVTITNDSGIELEGPVWLKIKSLLPAGSTLLNADGMHLGDPYLIMLDEGSKWPLGQALPPKTLYFSNPGRQKKGFEYQVFAVVPDEGS